MDFCSIWDRQMKKGKSRAVRVTEAITNHHKCHPLKLARGKGFLTLATSIRKLL